MVRLRAIFVIDIWCLDSFILRGMPYYETRHDNMTTKRVSLAFASTLCCTIIIILPKTVIGYLKC